MSVSDPLLKILKGKLSLLAVLNILETGIFIRKGHVLELRLNNSDQQVTDEHHCVQSLCETLETILRKGIKSQCCETQLP